MNKSLYRFLAASLYHLVWGGDLKGAANVPLHGPAVFIANHAKALGPIAVCSTLPMTLHFWMHAHMLDCELAPGYLRKDFLEPQLGLPARLADPAARLLAKITVPLLGAVGGIPAHHGKVRRQETYRASVDLLEAGEFLLIFPEDPEQAEDPAIHMAPFQMGFTRLGELFYERTGSILPFHPVMVHAGRRIVRVDQAVQLNPMHTAASERLRLRNVMEQNIRRMYLEAEAELAAPTFAPGAG